MGSRAPDAPGAGGRGLGQDLVAGTVVAAMLVPQAMAYAALAGVPPVAGLYAAAAALLVYGLLGPSQSLSVGPVAIDSLLTAQAVGALVALGGADAQRLAAVLALLAAAAYVAFWLLRLGVLAALLSAPMLTGFMHAAALVIAGSQVRHLAGVAVPEGATPLATLAASLEALAQAHGPTLTLGLLTLGLLLVWRRLAAASLVRLGVAPTFALAASRCAPLVGTVVAALAVVVLGLEAQGVATVGAVPAGLPTPGLPDASATEWGALAPTALAVAAVGVLEALSIARTLAARRHERVRPQAELLALGAANAASGLVGGFPVTGGLSRSMVNHQAGAASGRASIVTALLLVASLALLTATFAPVPRAALAAVVIAAVGSLLDLKAFSRAFRADPLEGAVALATFVTVLAWSVEAGMAVGAVLALLVYLRRGARPAGSLGRAFGELLRPRAAPAPLVADGASRWRAVRALHLANVDALEDALASGIEAAAHGSDLRVDLSAAGWVDASAREALGRQVARAHARGATLTLAGMPGRS